MKYLFYILVCLSSAIYLSTGKDSEGIGNNPSPMEGKTSVVENSAHDIQHCIEVLSYNLKGSQGIITGRTAPTVQFNVETNNFKHTVRLLQILRVKSKNIEIKVSETVSSIINNHLMSLFSGKGYSVYAFRKLII